MSVRISGPDWISVRLTCVRVWNLRVGVQGQGFGCEVSGFGCGVWSVGFRVWGLEFG